MDLALKNTSSSISERKYRGQFISFYWVHQKFAGGVPTSRGKSNNIK